MAEYLRDIRTAPRLLDKPSPKELLGGVSIEALERLYFAVGIPTPISGDPIARR